MFSEVFRSTLGVFFERYVNYGDVTDYKRLETNEFCYGFVKQNTQLLVLNIVCTYAFGLLSEGLADIKYKA